MYLDTFLHLSCQCPTSTSIEQNEEHQFCRVPVWLDLLIQIFLRHCWHVSCETDLDHCCRFAIFARVEPRYLNASTSSSFCPFIHMSKMSKILMQQSLEVTELRRWITRDATVAKMKKKISKSGIRRVCIESNDFLLPSQPVCQFFVVTSHQINFVCQTKIADWLYLQGYWCMVVLACFSHDGF